MCSASWSSPIEFPFIGIQFSPLILEYFQPYIQYF